MTKYDVENNQFYIDEIEEFVPLSSFLYCRAKGDDTEIYIAKEKYYTVKVRIGTLENLFRKYGFIRCHDSLLVNMNCIEKKRKIIDGNGGGRFELENGEMLDCSRRKKKCFFSDLKKYWITNKNRTNSGRL
jgi:DNA-binding LytR/AlgR family response regulator